MRQISKVSSGAVVFSSWQPMVVLHVEGEDALACPLVPEAGPAHRADMSLAWHELAEAGLGKADVRFRGVVCRRKVFTLQVMGQVDSSLVSRMLAVACREEARRKAENGPGGFRSANWKSGPRAVCYPVIPVMSRGSEGRVQKTM